MVKGNSLFWTWVGMKKPCMRKSYPSSRMAPFFSASECRKAGMREYVQVRGKGGMYYLKYTPGSARWVKRPHSTRAEEGRRYQKISTRKKRSSKKKFSSRKRKKRSSRRKKRSSRRKKRSSRRKKRSSRRKKSSRRYSRRGSVKTTTMYKKTEGGYRIRARAAYNTGAPLGSVRLLLNGKRKCLKLNAKGSPFWGAC